MLPFGSNGYHFFSISPTGKPTKIFVFPIIFFPLFKLTNKTGSSSGIAKTNSSCHIKSSDFLVSFIKFCLYPTVTEYSPVSISLAFITLILVTKI